MVSIVETRRRHRIRQWNLLDHYVHLLTVQRLAIEQIDLNHVEETIQQERQILLDLEALSAVRLPEPGQLEKDSARADLDQIALLTNRVVSLHRQNQELLSRLIAETAREIASLKIPPRRKSVYASTHSSGAMLDVHG